MTFTIEMAAGIYVVTAVLAYGLTFGAHQSMPSDFKNRDYYLDMLRGIISGLFGPLSLSILILDILGSKNRNCRTKFKFW